MAEELAFIPDQVGNYSEMCVVTPQGDHAKHVREVVSRWLLVKTQDRHRISPHQGESTPGNDTYAYSLVPPLNEETAQALATHLGTPYVIRGCRSGQVVTFKSAPERQDTGTGESLS